MSWFWWLLALLCAWAFIVLLRRAAEERDRRPPRPDADEGIDREELERAEREVRDLDAAARPEDGWQGDDWGPGAPGAPRYGA